MENKKDLITERILPIHEHLKINKIKATLFWQQEAAAFDIVHCFLEGNRYVFLNAYTQSGKTGVFNCLVNYLSFHECYKMKMGIEHIYYIIGDNQLGIKNQTIESYYKNCFNLNFTFYYEDYNGNTISFLKNSDMKQIVEGKKEVPSMDNNLFVIDESHYATKKKTNIVNKFLKKLGVNYMKADSSMDDTNSYILSVSATPWKELANDIYHRKPVVKLPVTDDYKGFKDFDENEQINVLYNKSVLKDNDICYQFFSEEVYNYLLELKKTTKRKHFCIVRSVGSGNIEINRDNTGNKYHIIYVTQKGNKPIDYNEMYDKIKNICIENTEEKNKFLLIVIKGAFRMGQVFKRENDIYSDIYKDFCGVCYDYSDSKDNVESTEQSLLGRFSGYITNRTKDAWKNTKYYISKKHYDMIKERYEDEENYKKETGNYKTPYSKTERKRVYGMEFVNKEGYQFEGFRPNEDLLKTTKPIDFDVTSYFNNNPKIKNLLSNNFSKIKNIDEYTYIKNGKRQLKSGFLDDIIEDIINFYDEIPNKYISGYEDENGKVTLNGGNRRIPTFNDEFAKMNAIDNGKRNGKLNKPEFYGCPVRKATIVMDANANGTFDKQVLQIQETIVDKFGTILITTTSVKEIETYRTMPNFDFELPKIKNNIEIVA